MFLVGDRVRLKCCEQTFKHTPQLDPNKVYVVDSNLAATCPFGDGIFLGSLIRIQDNGIVLKDAYASIRFELAGGDEHV